MRGIIPSKAKLLGRGVEVDPICERCGLEIETTEHALRDCEWAIFFWGASVLRISIRQDLERNVSIQDWILKVIHNRDEDFICTFVCHLWMMWRARNCLAYQGKMLDLPSCFKFSLSTLSEYKMINSIYVAEPERPLTLRSWNPPCHGTLKMNVDAAFKGLNEAAVGVIFRDENAAFTRGFSQKLEFCLDVLVAESTACLKGLLMAMNLNYHYLLVEVDCLELFHFLCSRKVPPIHAGNVIAQKTLFLWNFGGSHGRQTKWHII